MGIDRILDMGRTAINVTGDAMVTTVMGKMTGMLDEEVYKSNNLPDIDEAALAASTEPAGYDDFTAEGDPTEIGEGGDPNKYADIEEPTMAR